MEIRPLAYFRSPLDEKFGIPRQAGLVPSLRGTVVFCKEYARPEALRGMEDFDYLWLVWGFDRNAPSDSLTVRPPRLGGNRRVGVFASRSPFRPNGLGLSSVRIDRVDYSSCSVDVFGADLADGTPIYDVKPYLEYADSHPGAKSGFVDTSFWRELEVHFRQGTETALRPSELETLKGVLAQDPRPGYQDDSGRIYGLSFGGRRIRFTVSGKVLEVISIT